MGHFHNVCKHSHRSVPYFINYYCYRILKFWLLLNKKHGGPTSPRDSKERTLQSSAISADETPISETELIMAFVLTQGTGQTRRQSAARGKGRTLDSQCEKKKKKKKEGVNWLKAAGSLGSSGTVIVSGPAKQGRCVWKPARVCMGERAYHTPSLAFRKHCSKEDVCAVEWGASRGGGVPRNYTVCLLSLVSLNNFEFNEFLLFWFLIGKRKQ